MNTCEKKDSEPFVNRVTHRVPMVSHYYNRLANDHGCYTNRGVTYETSTVERLGVVTGHDCHGTDGSKTSLIDPPKVDHSLPQPQVRVLGSRLSR